jgi:hypothetical protein
MDDREELIRQLEIMRADLHDKTMQAEEWTATVGHSLKRLDLESLVAQLQPLVSMAKWAIDALEMELSNRMPMASLFGRLATLSIKNALRVLTSVRERAEAGVDEVWDEGTAIRLATTLKAGQDTLMSLVDRFETLMKGPSGGGSLGADEESERVSYPYDYRPPHYHGKGKGRKISETSETQENREARGQGKKDIFFSEETGSLEPQEALFFQEHGLTPEKREAYIQTPEAPEITEADIYDVIYCRGKWKRLAYGGWPCGSAHPRATADDIERAVQYLIFQGYRLRP